MQVCGWGPGYERGRERMAGKDLVGSYIYVGLLEWLTGHAPASPKVVTNRKSKNPIVF